MSKKYSFGIDIDGTVTAQEFLLPFINKKFQTNLVLADIKQYDLSQALSVDHQIFYDWFKETEIEMYENPPLQNEVIRILNNWHPVTNLNFITARETNATDVTTSWLKSSKIPYDALHIVGNASKVHAARTQNVELFFEDKHSNAVALSEELDIPVILFDAPYNREPSPKNVIRVQNWTEAENWVKKEFGI
ncbi:5' nucleotidase, NT5C type [Kurthia sibirica]|uniref:Nucleotidase n=1 Tax=Kurthia sibirica TaxID=202750 RepID=A0A2U3AM16_9BACL|nr:hypothetical protein [Kurthia sibirica]PWI25559.1 hypothetical protein DEX24_08105 [Kurthia sibirica]GEK33938.1 putative nucleotidase YqfW [Kurthia sibirica]